MKTLPVLTTLAALAAFALLPLSPGLAGSVLFLLALAPIASADYSRSVAYHSEPDYAALRRSERLGLAA